MTTNSRIKLDKMFDPNINRLSKSDFDNIINKDEDVDDKNI